MLKKTIIFKLALVCSVGILANACSLLGKVPGMGGVFGEEGYIRDRQGDYLEAESIPRLQVPNNMDAFVIDDLLIIPDLASAEGGAFLQVPRPRPLQGNPDRAVVIQRMDERSWVVVDARASQVWPRIRQYWREQGVELVQESPEQGLLDTSWFTTDENEAFKEKIRVIVRPGFQDDSAEISLLHVSAPVDSQVDEQIDWTEQPEDSEYTYQVLSDISNYLAEQIRLYQASTVSFLAETISDEGRADLRTEGEAPILHLDADYERSWAAVGRALERAEVEIVSEDMETGFFEVAFSDMQDDAEPGIFSRLLSLGNNQTSFPFRVSLQRAEDGVAVMAVSNSGASGEASGNVESSLTEEQQKELGNALLQTIRNFIS